MRNGKLMPVDGRRWNMNIVLKVTSLFPVSVLIILKIIFLVIAGWAKDHIVNGKIVCRNDGIMCGRIFITIHIQVIHSVVYPEFKGYYGEVSWMELNTVEGKFYIASKDSGLFVRLFDFYGLSSATKPFPELPSGDISFLDAIPPMGTKLATGLTTNTKVYGPQSELNHLSGTKKRTLYFYFGLPKTTNSKEKYSRPAVDNVF